MLPAVTVPTDKEHISLYNLNTVVLLLLTLCRGIPVLLWFSLYWKDGEWHKNWKMTSLAIFNIFVLCIVLFMNTGGLYASIDNMLSIFADPNSNISGVFSCADNSLL